MEYKFRISGINAMGPGPEIELNIKTNKDKPPKFRPPMILNDEISNGYIPLKLKNASELNGPIRYLNHFLSH